MRSPTDVLNSLSVKSKDPAYKYKRLYRNLYNPEFYLLAYKNIYANNGSVTPGVDGTSIDGMSTKRIDRIIASLKSRTYRPNPARRVYIPKKSNPAKKRPLGIPSGDDKLVQEVVRMILESIYEPNFSNVSHGFRPGRSCHTALAQIQTTFTGAKWFVEGDIKACFDSFDHHILISILRKRIEDENMITLMWKFLKAGYMEQWQHNKTYSGTPQGSGISPLLANIYLNELDTYMKEYQEAFRRIKRTRNPEYNRMGMKIHRHQKRNAKVWNVLSPAERKERARDIRKMKSDLLKLPPHDLKETGYKSLQYVRYADDFIVGIIGSKNDAQQLKEELTTFLKESLGLILSEEKTKITHTADFARFLGYDIYVSHDQEIRRTKNGQRRRVYHGKVRLRMPNEKWAAKLLECKAIQIKRDKTGKERRKIMPRRELVNRKDIDILSKVNSEIRGLYNYYALADNVSSLYHYCRAMKYSMLKTFGMKYRCQVSKIRAKYDRNGEFTVSYMTKAGAKESIFYHKGFKRKREPAGGQIDLLDIYKKYNRPNSLSARLCAKKCELCGGACDSLEMHQVKRLKDLKGLTQWEIQMKLNRRKTLAVCPSCHAEIHQTMT